MTELITTQCDSCGAVAESNSTQTIRGVVVNLPVGWDVIHFRGNLLHICNECLSLREYQFLADIKVKA